MRHLFALLLTGLVAACAPIAALDLLVPRDGYQRQIGIAYGEGPRRRLDIYRPEAATGPRPVVLFVYGGSWSSGERAQYRFVGQALAARGYVAVLPDYRLDPDGRFPGFVEDVAAAVAWTHRHVTAHGGDPARLYLMGHSAGAYNIAMVAADPRYLAAHGLDRSVVAGAIGLAGPYDFLPLDSATTRRVFGHAEDLAATQPIRLVDAATPPMLLLHGAEDDTVYARHSLRLAERLQALGVKAEAKLYPETGHIGIVLALSPLARDDPPVLSDLDRFIDGQ
ncbi:alpha/beta hydrolase [Desertibaculum subflavum]|uniref:alpha/beta hydrolase n=1 Tax=Desertibaculum subflavum TaxID=2268458 RepID=UPI000E66DC5F